MKIVATTSDPVAATLSDWRDEMSRAVRDLGELCEILNLPVEAICVDAAKDFPLFAPRPFLRRIRPGDPSDPLLRQLLPAPSELVRHADDALDPVADLVASPSPGLVHKYPHRVLVILTGVCAIHCRYCFRRHFPYAQHQAWRRRWPEILDRLASDRSVEEVIFSGGDPLTIDDAAWREILTSLEAMPHIRRIRIHSRLPIVIPSRITPDLLAMLTESRLEPILVIHANHPAEIDDEVHATLLRAARELTVLNQAVLLRGINDSATTLRQLSERLFACRVLPYYLNLLDRVAGAAHFDVPEAEGKQLVQSLRDQLPGYLVPRLVRDDGAGPAKRMIV